MSARRGGSTGAKRRTLRGVRPSVRRLRRRLALSPSSARRPLFVWVARPIKEPRDDCTVGGARRKLAYISEGRG